MGELFGAPPVVSPGAEQDSSVGSLFAHSDVSMGTILTEFMESMHGGFGPVLPVPLPPMPPKPRSRSSRGRSRFSRASALCEIMRRCISEFNTASGIQTSGGCIEGEVYCVPTDDFRTRFCDAAVDQSVKDCWTHAATWCRRMREGRRLSHAETETGASLFSRLRKSITDHYGRVPDESPYVPFVAELIKESEPTAPTVEMAPLLPEAVRIVITDPQKLFRPLCPEEEKEFVDLRRRYDFFGGDPPEWIKYHWRNDVHALWEYQVDCSEFVSHVVLAVPRSKDDKQRRIGASCPINFAWHRPEHLFPELCASLGLLGGALLGTIVADEGSVFWACLDESCAFASLLTPFFWWLCHAGPRIRASALPRKIWKKGWTENTWIRPLSKRLGMGNSWSVFLLMVIYKCICASALANCHRLAISAFVILNASSERDRISVWRASQGTVYIHVDDFVFSHSLEDVCNSAAGVVAAALIAVGFVVEFTPTYRVQKVVGLAVGEEGAPFLTVPLLRLGDLDRACELLAEAEFILPAMARTVVAVYVWFGLMWRPCFNLLGLSISGSPGLNVMAP